MVNLLVSSLDHLSATAFYRTWGVFKYINSISKTTGVEIEAYQMPKKLDWRTIQQTDISYFERPYTVDDLNKITMFKRMGIPVWLDYDDNLFQIQPENPAYQFYPKQCHEVIKKCLELSDIVTVSTQNLVKHYASNNTQVIKNALPKDMINRPMKEHQDNYIVWRGGLSHEGDIYCHWDEIKRLTQDYQVMFLGATPNFIKYEAKKNNNIKIIPPMQLENYLVTLFGLHPKAFIVPLDDNEFNKGKSNIAALEALITGSMTVAPAWEEWSDLTSVMNYGKSIYDATKCVMEMDNKSHRTKVEGSKHSESLAYLANNMKRADIIKKLLEIA